MKTVPISLTEIENNPVLRQLALYLAAFVILILGGGIIFFTQAKRVKTLWQQNNEIEEEIRQERQRIAVFSNWDWQQIEERAKLANYALPQKNDLQLVLFALQEPAKAQRFLIERMDFDMGAISASGSSQIKRRSHSRQKFSTVRIHLALVGPEANVFPFLKALEESLPLLAIQDFTFSRRRQGLGQKLVELNFQLLMYFAPSRTTEVVTRGKINPQKLLLSKQEMATVAKLRQFYNQSHHLLERLQLLEESFSASSSAKKINPFAD